MTDFGLNVFAVCEVLLRITLHDLLLLFGVYLLWC